MISNNWIEEKSIEIVKKSLLKTKLIDCSQINIGDKGVSWDGNILVFSNKKRNKNDVRIIPVQIKGTTKHIPKKKAYFVLDIEHVKNFYRNGGILFFCVYLNENNENHKIYYSSLLASDLWHLISKSCNNKVKIPLDEFPEENVSEIMIIIKNYIINWPKQTYMIGQRANSKDFSMLLNRYERIKIPFSVPNNVDDHLTFLTRDNHYIYGHVTSHNFDKLIGKGKISFLHEYPLPVCVNEKKYYNSYKVLRKNGKEHIFIGDILTIHAPDKDSKCELSIDIHGKLEHQLKSTKFIIDLYDSKNIKIGDMLLPLVGDFDKEINKLRSRLYTIEANKQALEMMDVWEELDYDKMKEIDQKSLDALTKAMLFNQKVDFENQDNPLLYGPLFLGNLRINLWATKGQKHYSVVSFNEEKTIALFKDTDKKHENPVLVPYCVFLSAEDYAYSSNLDFNKIYSTIEKGKWSEIAMEHILNALLEMIKAYDIFPKRKKELYSLMNRVCDYIVKQNIIDEIIMFINKMQILKRERDLKNREIKKVKAYLTQSNVAENRCALNLLLNNIKQAKEEFNSMKEEDKKRFANYPIYYFFDK